MQGTPARKRVSSGEREREESSALWQGDPELIRPCLKPLLIFSEGGREPICHFPGLLCCLLTRLPSECRGRNEVDEGEPEDSAAFALHIHNSCTSKLHCFLWVSLGLCEARPYTAAGRCEVPCSSRCVLRGPSAS